MRNPLLLCALGLSLAAAAGASATTCNIDFIATPPQTAEAQALQARHDRCMGRMMSDRVARGRTAPNWNLYDFCMKQSSAG